MSKRLSEINYYFIWFLVYRLKILTVIDIHIFYESIRPTLTLLYSTDIFIRSLKQKKTQFARNNVPTMVNNTTETPSNSFLRLCSFDGDAVTKKLQPSTLSPFQSRSLSFFCRRSQRREILWFWRQFGRTRPSELLVTFFLVAWLLPICARGWFLSLFMLRRSLFV